MHDSCAVTYLDCNGLAEARFGKLILHGICIACDLCVDTSHDVSEYTLIKYIHVCMAIGSEHMGG